jgi:hypothetical protein
MDVSQNKMNAKAVSLADDGQVVSGEIGTGCDFLWLSCRAFTSFIQRSLSTSW